MKIYEIKKFKSNYPRYVKNVKKKTTNIKKMS